MITKRISTVLIAGVLLVSLVAVGAVGTSGATATDSSAESQGEAYAGTHLAFEASSNALTNYTVGGEEAFSSIAVESQSETDAGAGAGASADLDLVTNIEGAGLSVAAESQTSTQIETESGAMLSAHDNEHGILVVEAGEDDQFVEAQLESTAEASDEGDHVTVTTDSKTGVFLVIGEGEVTVNDEGDVVADLESESTLAFRSYADGERDDEAESNEELIASGTAAAEVHVEERDGETVVDAVKYGQETSVEAQQEAEHRVDVTVERAISEGTIVMTTVSEETVGPAKNLEVTVDGEAAVEASSQSELEGAIGGEESAYMLSQDAQAEGEMTAYVAINHFSERSVSMDGSGDGEESSTDDGDGDDTEDTDDTTDDDSDASDDDETQDADERAGDDSLEESADELPGFGALVALVGLLAAVGIRTRR